MNMNTNTTTAIGIARAALDRAIADMEKLQEEHGRDERDDEFEWSLRAQFARKSGLDFARMFRVMAEKAGEIGTAGIPSDPAEVLAALYRGLVSIGIDTREFKAAHRAADIAR